MSEDEMVATLFAQANEDEMAAKAASPGPWHLNAEGDEVLAVDGITVAEGFALSGRQLRATAKHVARHDPDRAFRGVAATRAILVEYGRLRASYVAYPNAVNAASVAAVQSVIRMLAAAAAS